MKTALIAIATIVAVVITGAAIYLWPAIQALGGGQ
jgi:hypothetical protein